MEKKELVIGSWILKDENPVQVEDIPIHSVMTVSKKGCMGYWFQDIMSAKPVELTTEILEKNGWWLGDCEHKLESLGTTIKLDYYFGNDFTIRYDSDGKFQIERGFDNGEMELKYVHQLQMALRLFGIEKEIEL